MSDDSFTTPTTTPAMTKLSFLPMSSSTDLATIVTSAYQDPASPRFFSAGSTTSVFTTEKASTISSPTLKVASVNEETVKQAVVASPQHAVGLHTVGLPTQQTSLVASPNVQDPPGDPNGGGPGGTIGDPFAGSGYSESVFNSQYETDPFTGVGTGGDLWTNQDGDTNGGFQDPSPNGNDINDFDPIKSGPAYSWYRQAVGDEDSGNNSGASETIFGQATSQANAHASFNQGDVGQGFVDLAAAAGTAAIAGALAAQATKAYLAGNYSDAVANAGGAESALQTAFGYETAPAAQDALSSLSQSLYYVIANTDPTFAGQQTVPNGKVGGAASPSVTAAASTEAAKGILPDPRGLSAATFLSDLDKVQAFHATAIKAS